MAVLIFNQHVKAGLARAFQNGISALQIRAVPRKRVMFPQMLAGPRSSAKERTPWPARTRRSPTPRVRCVGHRPAWTVEVSLCGLRSRRNQIFNHSQHWQMALAQIRAFSGPIVHLKVDVGFVISAPGHRKAVAPDTLRIRWQKILGPTRRESADTCQIDKRARSAPGRLRLPRSGATAHRSARGRLPFVRTQSKRDGRIVDNRGHDVALSIAKLRRDVFVRASVTASCGSMPLYSLA